MDYFGQLADDLVEMAEEIERLYPIDGARVIKGLERLMKLAIEAENVRYHRGRQAAAGAMEAAAQMPGSFESCAPAVASATAQRLPRAA